MFSISLFIQVKMKVVPLIAVKHFKINYTATQQHSKTLHKIHNTFKMLT